VVGFRFVCLLAALGITIFAPSAEAGFFMLMDANGDVSFTDTPPSRNGRKVVVKFFKTGREPIAKTNLHRFSNVYDHIISDAAQKTGVDPLLIKSVIKVESDFNRFTVSSKGAKGLMQLMPDTAREVSVRNVFSAEENIHGGARYLQKMLNKFDGDARLALAAYNAGPTAVDNYGGIPPYQETVRYIAKVLTAYSHLSGYSHPIAQRRVTPYASTYTAPLKSNIYKTMTADGSITYTDKPMGRKVILKD